MENKLLIRTEMFGYSKKETEDYILKLQTEFDRKLAKAETGFREKNEQLESAYDLAQKEKQNLENENKLLEEKILQLTAEYEKTITEFKSEKEEAPRNNLVKAADRTDNTEKRESLPRDEFSRLLAAIQMSDESLLDEDQTDNPDTAASPADPADHDTDKIRRSLDELSASLSSFTEETLNTISRIRDSV